MPAQISVMVGDLEINCRVISRRVIRCDLGFTYTEYLIEVFGELEYYIG